MKPVFETTGTCLNIKLPQELDHPASELIRRESDRIMGKIYIRTICFDFGDTEFMDSSGVGLIMGRKWKKQSRKHRWKGGAYNGKFKRGDHYF